MSKYNSDDRKIRDQIVRLKSRQYYLRNKWLEADAKISYLNSKLQFRYNEVNE